VEILYTTKSVCPVCLQSIHADICRDIDEIFLVKNCQEHGRFEAVIWRGEPDFLSWARFKKNAANTFPRQVNTQDNCPHNCGLCQAHGQRSCTVLFELTQLCNLHCPVCFANASPLAEHAASSVLPLAQALEQLAWIREQAGGVVLQLSGGEPTVYPHLLAVVRAASKLFPAVQLNTNGILLAENPYLAKELKEAGLSWVFLQCDGVSDTIHRALRGKALAATKHTAIQYCKDAGLAVVLVATVASGVNDAHLGDLLRYGLSLFPTVRGIHLQPMTLSGRNSFSRDCFLKDRPTITLPEVITKLSQQSHGFIKQEHASPPSCEHSLCSFHCRYYVNADGSLEYIREQESCGCETASNVTHEGSRDAKQADRPALEAIDAPQRSIDAVIHSWQGDEGGEISQEKGRRNSVDTATPFDAFDAFIAKARSSTFSVTCMAFQDVHTLDVERLQGCCVHVFNGHDKLLPFCAYNLTSIENVSLYR